MKKILMFIILTIFLFSSCESKKVDGIYATREGPYFKFIKGKFFEFGVPGDPNPLKGNFSNQNGKLNLSANSIMVGHYATTNFTCHIEKDTLFIDVLEITHPNFEIFIDKIRNFARTKRDTIIKEFQLNSPEAEEELFIYYKLVYDKFIKKEGE